MLDVFRSPIFGFREKKEAPPWWPFLSYVKKEKRWNHVLTLFRYYLLLFVFCYFSQNAAFKTTSIHLLSLIRDSISKKIDVWVAKLRKTFFEKLKCLCLRVRNSLLTKHTRYAFSKIRRLLNNKIGFCRFFFNTEN